MRVLSRPKKTPRGNRPPSWWRKIGKKVGTIVEHRGNVWALRDGLEAGSYWEYLSTYGEWHLREVEAAVAQRRAAAPKVGPKGGAGGSKASRR